MYDDGWDTCWSNTTATVSGTWSGYTLSARATISNGESTKYSEWRDFDASWIYTQGASDCWNNVQGGTYAEYLDSVEITVNGATKTAYRWHVYGYAYYNGNYKYGQDYTVYTWS